RGNRARDPGGGSGLARRLPRSRPPSAHRSLVPGAVGQPQAEGATEPDRRAHARRAGGELRSDLEPEQIGSFLGVIFDGMAVQRAAGYDPPVEVLLQLIADALRPV